MEQMLQKQRLYEQIFGYVMRHVRDTNEAEELTQEAIVRSFLYFDQFDASKGRFLSWVRGIAYHCMIDRKRRRYHANWEELPERESGAPSPEEQVSVGERTGYMLSALQQLKCRERSVLRAMYIEGKTHQEIADEFGMTCTNASTLLSRARRSCMDAYKKKEKYQKQPSSEQAQESCQWTQMSKMILPRLA